MTKPSRAAMSERTHSDLAAILNQINSGRTLLGIHVRQLRADSPGLDLAMFILFQHFAPAEEALADLLGIEVEQ